MDNTLYDKATKKPETSIFDTLADIIKLKASSASFLKVFLSKTFENID